MPRLLIVDDEPLIRRGFVKMIERLAPEWEHCEECESGLDAIGKIRENPYDLIFSDIRMPDMDGLEMMELLQAQGYRIPLVYITGYDDFAYAQRALRARAYDYLLKPVYDDEIQRVLDKFSRDFYPASGSVASAASAKLRQFEFQLLNALETLEFEKIAAVLQQGTLALENYLPKATWTREIVRIVEGFFLKHGMDGYESHPPHFAAGSPDIPAILHTLNRQLRQMRDRHHRTYSDHIIDMARSYIRDNVERAVTLSEVAERVHLNMNYFSEYFKDKTGETFTQYVSRTRMDAAKQMLLDPRVKINEIAERMGYRNTRYFSKSFKHWVGITPKEFRECSHIYD